MKFWSEFQRLGGVDAVGYPASQRFTWDGFTVQVFQRVVFQWRPEVGQAYFVNVFDRLHDLGKDDWLFSVRMTPRHHVTSLAVLDAYPAIKAKYYGVVGDPLQANGFPTSDVEDFGNAYVLRCQRVVFQQWKEDVPWARKGQVTVALGGDIAKEAGVLPDPDALRPPAPVPSAAPVVVLDPGHGGFETGAANGALVEKNVNLDVARRLRGKLEAAGLRVILTREGDSQVNLGSRDLNGDGRVDTDDDLQARVDASNDAAADVFVSIHANGGTPAMRGASTYYCRVCPTAAANLKLAQSLQRAMVAGVSYYGAGAFGAGVFDEAGLGKPYGHLFVIGPRTPRVARPLQAPAAALAEMLFVSNAQDAALLARDDVRETLASSLASGIRDFLAAR